MTAKAQANIEYPIRDCLIASQEAAQAFLVARYETTLDEAINRASRAAQLAIGEYEGSGKTEDKVPESYLDMAFNKFYLPYILHLAKYGKQTAHVYKTTSDIEYDD